MLYGRYISKTLQFLHKCIVGIFDNKNNIVARELFWNEWFTYIELLVTASNEKRFTINYYNFLRGNSLLYIINIYKRYKQ